MVFVVGALSVLETFTVISLRQSFYHEHCLLNLTFLFHFLISPLFNQVGQLRTSSQLQLRPGQDKAKQCDKNNNPELYMG
jgi:hypothetical protein